MGGEGKSGDDLDMKFRGVRQEFFDVFLGIISSVFLRVFVVRMVGVWWRRITERADSGQLREFFTLKPPALVVVEMKVEFVEFVVAHPAEK